MGRKVFRIQSPINHITFLEPLTTSVRIKSNKKFIRFLTDATEPKKPVNGSWRMDETYIKINGKCVYLYRAVDKYGDTIDFLLRAKRDTISAKAFFRKTIKENGRPEKVTIDKRGSNKAALDSLNTFVSKEKEIEIRKIKYLNNIAEQDHRFIKKRTKPMLGFKSFQSSKITLSGIENIHMIQKGQILDQSPSQFAFNNFASFKST